MNVLVPGQSDGHPSLTWFFSSFHFMTSATNVSFGMLNLLCDNCSNCVKENRTRVGK